jgi:hypothetical protein
MNSGIEGVAVQTKGRESILNKIIQNFHQIGERDGDSSTRGL